MWSWVREQFKELIIRIRIPFGGGDKDEFERKDNEFFHKKEGERHARETKSNT